MRKLPLDTLHEIARSLTQNELEKYIIPDEIGGALVLTTLFEKDDRIFILYVPAENRDDANVIARTRVNSITGEAVVEFIGLQQKQDE